MVAFVGVDPAYMLPGSGPGGDEARAEEVRRGERERGYAAWVGDGFGLGGGLRGKREKRNAWGVGQGVFGGEEVDQDVARGSGIKIAIVDGVEVLSEEMQPWESTSS